MYARCGLAGSFPHVNFIRKANIPVTCLFTAAIFEKCLASLAPISSLSDSESDEPAPRANGDPADVSTTLSHCGL